MADMSACDNPRCRTAVPHGDNRHWPELWYRDNGRGQKCEFCSLGCLGQYVELVMRKPLRELQVGSKPRNALMKWLFGPGR